MQSHGLYAAAALLSLPRKTRASARAIARDSARGGGRGNGSRGVPALDLVSDYGFILNP